MAAVIAHEDVLQHIYAFLQGSGYHQTILALQAESGVAYNTIHVPLDAETTATARPATTAVAGRRGGVVAKSAYPPATPGGLERAILEGSWDEVLYVYVEGLLLPAEVKNVLYEVIFDELLTVHGLQPAARALLHNAPTFVQMKLLSPTRYARLERMLEEFDLAQWETMCSAGADRHAATAAHPPPHPATQDVQGRREEVLRLLQREIRFVYDPYDGALPAALLLATSQRRDSDRKSHAGADTRGALKRDRSNSDATCMHGEESDAVTYKATQATCASNEGHDGTDHRVAHPTQPNQSDLKHELGARADEHTRHVQRPPPTSSPQSVIVASGEELLDYPVHAPRRIVAKLTSYVGEKVATCCRAVAVFESSTAPSDGVVEHLLVGRGDGVVDFVQCGMRHGRNEESAEGSGGVLVTHSAVHTEGVLVMTFDTATSHTDPVTRTTASSSSMWVAVGYRDGWVKIYNLQTRKLVRRFAQTHSMGITALLFCGDTDSDHLFGHHALLLSASFDTTVHVLDVLTGSVLSRLPSGHHGMYVHALSGLCLTMPSKAYGTQTGATHTVPRPECTPTGGHTDSCARTLFMSAGNDGSLGVWCMRVTQDKMRVSRVGQPRRLREVYGEFSADECATVLLRVDESASPYLSATAQALTAHSVTRTTHRKSDVYRNEIVMLTRGQVACVLSVHVMAQTAQQSDGSAVVKECEDTVEMTVLCAIRAAHPLCGAALYLSYPSSLPAPVLSLFVSDKQGTVLIYSIKMIWRDVESWRDRGGGAVKLPRAMDESAAVIVDHGRAISDLQLCCVPGMCAGTSSTSTLTIVAYSPSLSAVYFLR